MTKVLLSRVVKHKHNHTLLLLWQKTGKTEKAKDRKGKRQGHELTHKASIGTTALPLQKCLYRGGAGARGAGNAIARWRHGQDIPQNRAEMALYGTQSQNPNTDKGAARNCSQRAVRGFSSDSGIMARWRPCGGRQGGGPGQGSYEGKGGN